MRFEIEHIIPERVGGKSVRDNLWLSCPTCNRFKGSKIEAVDPDTQTTVPLFNPRTQDWFEHFEWSLDGIHAIIRNASAQLPRYLGLAGFAVGDQLIGGLSTFLSHRHRRDDFRRRLCESDIGGRQFHAPAL